MLIVEDVAYREMAFDDATALPSLWSLGPDVVLQAGTFSKIFCPGVRLGWAAGPAEVVAQLAAAKQLTDQCAGGLGQRMVEEYGRAGHFERQIPQARALYASHWRALAAALERELAGHCTWSEPTGGFFTWLTLPEGSRHASRCAPAATDAGVTFVPGPPFYAARRRARRAAAVLQPPRRGRVRRGRAAARRASSEAPERVSLPADHRQGEGPMRTLKWAATTAVALARHRPGLRPRGERPGPLARL